MSLRTGFRQSGVLTFAVLAIMAWLVLNALKVGSLVQSPLAWETPTVGQGALGGLVGLLVMVTFLGLLLVLFSEIGHGDPAPDTWPPER